MLKFSSTSFFLGKKNIHPPTTSPTAFPLLADLSPQIQSLPPNLLILLFVVRSPPFDVNRVVPTPSWSLLPVSRVRRGGVEAKTTVLAPSGSYVIVPGSRDE